MTNLAHLLIYFTINADSSSSLVNHHNQLHVCFHSDQSCEMNSEKKLTASPALTDEDDVEDILREEEDTSTSCRRHSISATR